ncbi:hypothetical protein RJ639_042129 [Escallonia herrerae]|uniref:peroxidase n=1 Tax=Escallonia herrerae TaxID=1293975 RepID=A0AA88WD78_9ASTE|nr:hypothetical protein RJ639_042129 [Escallonia herrerae]
MALFGCQDRVQFRLAVRRTVLTCFTRPTRWTNSKSASSKSTPLENITAKFTANGLDMKDVVVLSGAHTIGYAQCFTFKRRLFNFKGSGKPDPTLDSSLLSNLQSNCPNLDGSNSKLNLLDVSTGYMFDNSYYKNLVSNTGLLEYDQALMGNPSTAAIVNDYSTYPFHFANDFAVSMMKLGNTGVLTGQAGQIRKRCGALN